MDEYNCAGIYAFYNIESNTIYIGKSSNIKNRYATHKHNFLKNSDASPMYKEPFENFVFIVLQKLSDDEYEKFGALLERLFIIQSMDLNIELYNRTELSNNILFDILWVADTKRKINDAIKNKCGNPPYVIKRMTNERKQSIIQKMKRLQRDAATPSTSE